MVDWIAVGLVRALSFFLARIPLEQALGIGRFVGALIARTSERRRVAYVNLKAAFGVRYTARERKEIVRKHFLNLAQNGVEVLRFPKMGQAYFERHIIPEHRERYEETVRTGRGTILITPHFGNWELSQILSALVKKPLFVLTRRQKHSRLDAFLNQLRAAHGSSAIHKGTGIRDLIRSLRTGGAVGVLGDLSGGRSGIVIRFFGRKTTAPAGIFEIAKRTHSTILPCFMVRADGGRHRVHVAEPFSLVETGDRKRDLQETVQNYYRLLEEWIERYPDQWFWLYKRWKYCFTKRILILKDDRAGHTTQSEAVLREFENVRNALPQDYEVESSSIDVAFKTPWHRRFFYFFAFFFRPFAQGRLACLSFFLDQDCALKLRDVHADVIISTGSSLAPLNLLLKRENLAKSVVVMKPSFPYGPGFFDLLIVPAHDSWPKHLRNSVRTWVTPNSVSESLLQESAARLMRTASLGVNGAGRISVFIGGKTKSYRFDPDEFRRWLVALKHCAEETGSELLMTTSRRTEPEITSLIKKEMGGHPALKLLVIANESNLDHVTYGMLALSDVAVVTEDSASMISEAVSAGKGVLVMRLGNGKLSKKHNRFHQLLESNELIRLADASTFRAKLALLNGAHRQENFLQEQSRLLQEALRKLI